MSREQFTRVIGFPGGLGPEKLCLFARKSYGVLLTEDRARELKAQWLERWPEMELFFQHVGDLVDADTITSNQGHQGPPNHGD